MPPRIAVAPCRKMPDYLASVRAVGGDPWELNYEVDAVDVVVRSCAGLVLPGGVDVDPARYEETRHATVTDVDVARDEYEVALVRAALAADLPIFAICRGLQVMNVAAGGSLIQDIPSQVGSAVPHQVADPKDAIAHDVSLGPGSRLAHLMGHAAVGGRLPVNSRHHQAVRRTGQNLAVVARAADGIVEATENPGARFFLTVQWHPENFVESGTFLPLFAGLLAASR